MSTRCRICWYQWTEFTIESELARLRALEDRLLRYIGYCKAVEASPAVMNNLEFYVIADEANLDEMLTEFAESGDAAALHFLEPGSGNDE